MTINNLSSFTSAANWLKPPDLDQKKRQAPRYLTRAYWHNNSRKLLFLCSYALLSLLLFLGAMLQHRQGGGWYMVAKGCGQCLNFNCTFVMVPVWGGGAVQVTSVSIIKQATSHKLLYVCVGVSRYWCCGAASPGWERPGWCGSCPWTRISCCTRSWATPSWASHWFTPPHTSSTLVGGESHDVLKNSSSGGSCSLRDVMFIMSHINLKR